MPPLTRRPLLVGAAAALGLFLVLALLVHAQWLPLHRLDGRLDERLHRVAAGHGGYTDLLTFLTDALAPTTYRALAVIAAVVLLWRYQQPRLAAYVAVTILAGGLVDSLAKAAVGRPRPLFADPVATAHGMSFPSGHAFGSFVAWGLLVILLGRRRLPVTLPVAVVAVLVVGFTRIGLGVHFLSDIIGGWLLGATWLLALTAVFVPLTVSRRADALPTPR